MTAIYRDYDQATLDAQYFLRGRVANVQDFFERWARASAETRGRLDCKLDLAYGPSAAETLDIFLTNTGGGPAPVHVFIHGGYWQAMDKSDHSFIAEGFVPHGAIVVVVNYGLAPAVGMDEIVRQMRAALAWIWRNAASFGGDPARITVSGHSAGGHLAAMAASTDWPGFAGDLPADLVKGAVMIAGLYDLEPIRLSYLNKVLNLTAAEVRRHSPLNLDIAGRPKLVLCVGADETDEFHRQQQVYAAALIQKGLAPRIVAAQAMHHFQVLEALAIPGTFLHAAGLALLGLKAV
jgi:arylformamidase